MTSADIPESADQTLLIQALQQANRDQRERELQSLATLLKAEMDRRTLETEQSLRYVIAHQIQGQQDLDELYQRVDRIDYIEEKQ
jgi:hypothetical protein